MIPTVNKDEAQKPCPECGHWMWPVGIDEDGGIPGMPKAFPPSETYGEPIIACPHCGYTERDLLAIVSQVLAAVR